MDQRMIKDPRTSFATSSSFIIFQILTAVAMCRTTKNNVKRNVFKFVFHLFVLVILECMLDLVYYLDLFTQKTIQIWNFPSQSFQLELEK